MNRKYVLMGAAFLAACAAFADVRLPAVFGSGMVVQREFDAPIWGWAEPGEKVSVAGSWGAKAEAVAGDDGRWSLKLETPKAGGPFAVTVEGRNRIVLEDVLSGDVWLCSGQSNMARNINSIKPVKDIEEANYPKIRLFQVRYAFSQVPLSDTSGKWIVCSPATVGGFSSTAYFFGRKLHRDLNIPIGLLQSAYGGTCIEAWTPMESQIGDPLVRSVKENYDKAAAVYDPEKAQEKFAAAKKEWERKVADWNAAGGKGDKPRAPEKAPHPQRHSNYPANLYNGMMAPIIPFAIKGAIWYQGESNAGDIRRAENYRARLECLVASWRTAWGQGDFPFYFVQLPNYQKPWTAPVENGGWPVLREAFMNVSKDVPDTGMAITIDIGEEKDIHPKNKQDVGDRLGRLALHKAYGVDGIVWTGPIFTSCKFEDGKAVVKFETGGAPLSVKGARLEGFALVGDDGRVAKADAAIQGDDVVVVSSGAIKNPVAVYYAWAINPEGANLVNKEGLPASPFRFGSLLKK